MRKKTRAHKVSRKKAAPKRRTPASVKKRPRSTIRAPPRQKKTVPRKKIPTAPAPIKEPPLLFKGCEPPLLAAPVAEQPAPEISAPLQDVAPAAPPAISSVPVPSTTVEEPAATPAVASDKKPATPLLPPPGPLVLTVRVRHWWFKVPDKEILLASGSHCFAVATTDKSGIVRFEHLSPGRYSIAVASGHVCEKMIDLKNSSTAGFFI